MTMTTHRTSPLNTRLTKQSGSLIFWGAVLFFLGLLQGGVIPLFYNERMALSAHLAAVQSGLALMVFGLIWHFLKLTEKLIKLAYWCSLSSMYLIWLAISFSAILGASKMLPIAGQGFEAHLSIEFILAALLYFGSAQAIIAGGLLVIGLKHLLRTTTDERTTL